MTGMKDHHGNDETCSTCGHGECSQGAAEHAPLSEPDDEEKAVARRMSRIKKKILVLSGKGGVGKSTVAVNIAAALSRAGKKVGLMDIDIHGPSVPKLLGMHHLPTSNPRGGIRPADGPGGLKVMSIGFFLKNGDDAVIWRGPMKYGVIRQFLSDVEWGDLDFLIVDSPPGTGDEPLSVAQMIRDVDGAVIVTTPQDIAVDDVKRSVSFCGSLSVPVIGVVENMCGFVCPHCSQEVDIFKRGGGALLAREMKVPYLGAIPIDPAIVLACDNGVPFILDKAGTPAAEAFEKVISPLLALDRGSGTEASTEGGAASEVVAVPVVDGKVAMHFGHCENFRLFTVDREKNEIVGTIEVEAPPHEPGLLPGWLREKGATRILAGGMGTRALGLFSDMGIEVETGIPSGAPESLVNDWLRGDLVRGRNVCDH